jgi:hypothetical protein
MDRHGRIHNACTDLQEDINRDQENVYSMSCTSRMIQTMIAAMH